MGLSVAIQRHEGGDKIFIHDQTTACNRGQARRIDPMEWERYEHGGKRKREKEVLLLDVAVAVPVVNVKQGEV